MKVFSIFDRVAGVYADPFVEKNDALAVRRFVYSVSRSPMICADCDLYCLGEFDEVRGVIVGYESPQFVKRYEVSA